MYVYIDESGILTPGQGDYFLVAAYAVSDREVASRCLKKIRQTLKKQYRMKAELKYNNSRPETRMHCFQAIFHLFQYPAVFTLLIHRNVRVFRSQIFFPAR